MEFVGDVDDNGGAAFFGSGDVKVVEGCFEVGGCHFEVE